MALKLFVLPSIAFLIALFTPIWFQQSEACSCGPSLIPLRCRADFVAIVLIREHHRSSIGLLNFCQANWIAIVKIKEIAKIDSKWIRFKVKIKQTFLDKYLITFGEKYFQIFTSKSHCKIEIKIGRKYLLAIRYNFERKRYELTPCNGFVLKLPRKFPRKRYQELYYYLLRRCQIWPIRFDRNNSTRF
ncbi:hypothetical protein SSS_07876 [Sarcoptes scabiei]|uniref:Netrin module non-TIMP type domain-containing protein n=1 Tax=Sarcoptes scabiei TaxID=52283 RepID=A0A834VIT4_SARSC|nr:hypothetical protein SSS_07876 [Sarcoptes scabiei]